MIPLTPPLVGGVVPSAPTVAPQPVPEPAAPPPPFTDELAGALGAAPAFSAPPSPPPTLAQAPDVGPPPIPPAVTDELAGAPGAPGPVWPPPEWSAAPPAAPLVPAVPSLGPAAPTAPPAIPAPEQASAAPAIPPPDAGPPDVLGQALSLARLSPEEFALTQFQREQEIAKRAKQALAPAQATAAQDAADNAAIFARAQERARQAREELLAESQRISSMQIDPNRWFSDASLPRQIMSVLSVVIGGLAAPAGGRNQGVEVLSQIIDRDIAAQQANLAASQQGLAARRGLVSEMAASAEDEFKAAEAARIAIYERVAQQVEDEAANYDPAGTTALRLATMLREIRAKQAAAVTEFETKYRQIEIDNAKLDLDRRKQQEIERANLADEKLKAYATALDAKRVQNDAARVDLDAKRVDLDAQKIAAEQQRLEEERAKAAKDDVRKYGIGGPAKAVVQPDGSITVRAGEPLMNADGTVFKARKEEEAAKLSKMSTAAGEAVDIIDEIIAIRDRVGGESSVFNSDDKQRLDVLQNRLVILIKGGTEGMSSDEDMKKIAAAAGAADVRSFRARAAGLEKGRERIVQEYNRTLRSNQYTGPTIEFPNRFAGGAPAATADEVRLKNLLVKPSVSIANAETQAMRIARARMVAAGEISDVGRQNIDEKTSRKLLDTADRIAKNYKDISPEQIEGIDALAAAAATDQQAAKDLAFIAKAGQTAKIREYAAQAQPRSAPDRASAKRDAQAEEQVLSALRLPVPASDDGSAAKARLDAVREAARALPAPQRSALAARLRSEKASELGQVFQRRLSSATREQVLRILEGK